MSYSGLRRRDVLRTVIGGCGALVGCTAAESGASVPTATGVPTEVEALADQFEDRPVWNVEAHGITGDGRTKVGHAVHELLEAVDRAGGGIVYFPPGRYLFERTPLVGDETFLVGAGRSTVFEGTRYIWERGGALLSNRGYDQPGYTGASNWGVANVRIDTPETNGIMPAHADTVRLENIYGDATYCHHIDIVSSRNVVVDGYWASRGGDSVSDTPIQFDVQQTGITRNGIWDGETRTLVMDDDTPTKACTLRDFEIAPKNGATCGVQLHRGKTESITIADGTILGCQYTAIRADRGEPLADLTIDGVSCIDNARGITLGYSDGGRRGVTIDDVTIRTTERGVAAGAGIYAAGVDEADLSNVTVDGAFASGIIFEEMSDLEMSDVTVTGVTRQAFRFRENVEATLTRARAADCGGAGIYSGEGSRVTYGDVTFDGVGREIVADGEIQKEPAPPAS
ncbi:glycosyl hydrolase family 28-related protein [Natronococcus wangiae]|uniref:glycosyl hydrolase family 28-related protein n=1 Tax=Natronococcus wangiae TaxID=3068275 RepID=UPI00273F34BD|nr:glycosyl hydrolase family 28-related protein [Natronococcus sp. AD5]